MVKMQEFKTAVGKFPTGVTVITTSMQDKFFGFTANTFTSVSLSPPLISFCLDKKAGSFKAFQQTHKFAISILAGDQEGISAHFASSHLDKFLDIEYKIGQLSNSPLISGAVCWLECSKYDQFECGDHYIFIGEVTYTQVNNSNSPLLYFAKSYQEIK